MVCPYCQSELTVSNSRPQKRSNQTWRRRPCTACGAVFTTTESLDLSKVLQVVSGAEKRPFDRDRLFVSIYESLRHRPMASSDARALADTVIAHLMLSGAGPRISVRTIVETVVNTLQRFDRLAATHYAAFHPITSRTLAQ